MIIGGYDEKQTEVINSKQEAKKHRRSKSIPTEQDVFGNTHEFDFSVVEDDEDKEIYLILLVHGIGSDVGT